MKKSVVALLVILALVVLVSPGIVGRIAERSVGDSIEWAAEESGDVAVSSEHFDRGWFSSQGRHRIEILEPGLQQALRDAFGAAAADGAPSLVIDTRLDHGLVPVSSMVRDKGTLMPGLGSAVSTLAIEFADGESHPVPGTVYSRIGLTGVYTANYVVDAGSHGDAPSITGWGPADLRVSIDPRSERSFGEGSIGSLAVVRDGDELRLGEAQFSFDATPGRFGMSLGEVSIRLGSLSVTAPGQPPVTAGAVSIDASSSASASGERLDGSFDMALSKVAVEGYGETEMWLALRYTGVDPQALAQLVSALDAVEDGAPAGLIDAVIRENLAPLVAAGFELHVDRFDVALPQGEIRTTMRFSFAETDPASFAWTSALLTLDAEARLVVSEDFVDFAMMTNPEAGVVVGMGYLKKDGDDYVMDARYRKGLLAINGAPMPVPLNP